METFFPVFPVDQVHLKEGRSHIKEDSHFILFSHPVVKEKVEGCGRGNLDRNGLDPDLLQQSEINIDFFPLDENGKEVEPFLLLFEDLVVEINLLFLERCVFRDLVFLNLP